MKIFWGILGLLLAALVVVWVMRAREGRPGVVDATGEPAAAYASAIPVYVPKGRETSEADVFEGAEGKADRADGVEAAQGAEKLDLKKVVVAAPGEVAELSAPAPAVAPDAAQDPYGDSDLALSDPILSAVTEQITGKKPEVLSTPDTSSPSSDSHASARSNREMTPTLAMKATVQQGSFTFFPVPIGAAPAVPVTPAAPRIDAPAYTKPAAASSSSSTKPAVSGSGPAKLVKQDDGTTLVDDRFVIKGAGTKADPYRVTWEQLVSAQEVYQPRLNRKVIPDRVKMLDGKWVRISGYIAFPIMASSNDEMLMMLNQWDGCCIGVPPTPYDAIEVKLDKPAKGEERLRATGTVQGILRVDPYLVKDWLVSLYLMDNASVSDTGGSHPMDSPQHQR